MRSIVIANAIISTVLGTICILNQCFIHNNYSERDPGSNPRLKVEELHCEEDRSSQSSDNEEDSSMEVEHQGIVVSC